jgi:hypothetical protein
MANFPSEQAPLKWADYYGQPQAKALAETYILGGAAVVDRSILVTGISGTGKTTWVRLLIASLACLDRPDNSIEPCGKCAACLAGDARLRSKNNDIYWVQPGGLAEETINSQVKTALQAAAKGQKHSDRPDKDILWVVLDEFQAFPSDLRQQVLLQSELEIPGNNARFIFITMQEEKLSIEDRMAITRRGEYLRLMPYTDSEITHFLMGRYSLLSLPVAKLIAAASHNSIGLATAYYGSLLKRDPLLTEEVALHLLHLARNSDRWLLWDKLQSRAAFMEIKVLLDNLLKFVEPSKLAAQLQKDILDTADSNKRLSDDQQFAMIQINQFQQHYRTANLLNYLATMQGLSVVKREVVLANAQQMLNYSQP